MAESPLRSPVASPPNKEERIRAMVADVLVRGPRLSYAEHASVGSYVFDFLTLYGPHTAMVLEVASLPLDGDDLSDKAFRCEGYAESTGFPVMLVAGDPVERFVRLMLFAGGPSDGTLEEPIPMERFPRRLIETLRELSATVAEHPVSAGG